MFIKQFYTSCLSEAAYYIESEGEAAIIDPLRDIDSYIVLAEQRKAKIKFIFETHFHADFISGHLDLSNETGAPIIFGPGAKANYNIYQSKDKELFLLGNIAIEVLHTPGHTIESTCYLLYNEKKEPYALFSGDTLLVGDVGRPDLNSGNMDSEELAGMMYDSIHQKLITLPDNVLVYPAHGPGSACGKKLGADTSSTIGEQKKTNYALQAQTKEAFVKIVTSGLVATPKYFSINTMINQQGYESLKEVLSRATKALDVSEFKKTLDAETFMLDTRHATEFTQGFIPGAIFIGLEGRFAEWAGSLLPFDKQIVLITDKGKEEEAVTRLARVGFSKISGFLKGGFPAWKEAKEPIDMIIDIEPDELLMDIPFDPKLTVLDVRREMEFAEGHLVNAVNMPLQDMYDIAQLAGLEESENIYIHCAGGYRSVIAASLLKRQGYHNLRNVLGGWDKIKLQQNVKIVQETEALN
ncbi:MAG: MBL fold metallo-hydrolase [Ferruginibacter sp.]|nr:MBL fold metallo-hydrolase [Ferruginibacter sp.]